MKRLLVLIIVLSLFPFGVGARAAQTENSDYIFACGLGLIDADSVLGDDPLTRIELGRIFYNVIFGNSEYNKDYYSTYDFADVEPKDRNIAGVMADLGIMCGDGKNFMPAKGVTYNELMKAFVSFLGYDQKANYFGGYPSGYLVCAADMSLSLSGASGGNAYVTVFAAATLLRQALEVDICTMQNGKMHILENINYLEHYMGIKIADGMISGNFLTNLYNSQSCKYDSIFFDGTSMKLTDKTATLQQCLGMNVKIFYQGDYSDAEIVWYEKKESSIYDISAGNIGEVGRERLICFDGSDEKKYVLADDVALIYNGTFLSTYTEEKINPFKATGLDGGLRLVDKDRNGTIDFVVVSAYTTSVVGGVIDMKIYDEYSQNAPVDITNYIERNIDICNVLGDALTPESIRVGHSVSVMRDAYGEIKKIIVTKDVLEGTLDEIVKSDSKIKAVKIDGTEIEVANGVYINDGGLGLTLGAKVKIFFNCDGAAAVIDEAGMSEDGCEKGYIVDVVKDKGLSNDYSIRIFTANGTMQDYAISRHVIINKNGAKSSSDLLTKAGTDLKGNVVRQPLLYKVDDSGKTVTWVYLADNSLGFHNGLYEFPTKSVFYRGMNSFDGYFSLASDVLIFSVPDAENRHDYSQYSIASSVLQDMSMSQITAYGMREEAMVSEIVVVNNSLIGKTIDSRGPILMVESVKNIVNEDGEPMVSVTGHMVAGISYSKGTFVMRTETLKGFYGGELPQPGDVMRTATFTSDNNEIDVVTPLFDYSEKEPKFVNPSSTSFSVVHRYVYGKVIDKVGDTVRVQLPSGETEVHCLTASAYNMIVYSKGTNKNSKAKVSAGKVADVFDEKRYPGKASDIILYSRGDTGIAIFVINDK